MLILGLDTTTLVSSAALIAGDTLLAEITQQTQKTHSERLLPQIAELLALAEMDKKDLEAVAVSSGPGSFTGLRIGLATAKALAYALRIPIVGVSTLAALAYGNPAPGGILAPMLDAQKGNIYLALYRWQGGTLTEITPPAVRSFTAALGELTQLSQPVIAMGEAAVMFRQEIQSAQQAGADLWLAPPHCILPRAGSVALLGQKMLQQGIVHDCKTLEPHYIRRSEAEELWEKRQDNAKQN